MTQTLGFCFETGYDMSKIPRTFKIDLTYDEWKKIFILKEEDSEKLQEKMSYTSGWRVDQNYTNIFADKFNEINSE